MRREHQPRWVLKKLRESLHFDLALTERDAPRNPRVQGQREALRHVLTTLDSLEGAPFTKPVRES